MNDNDLLPEEEAAAHVCRHPQTLRKQRREGTLPFAYLKIGGRYFYRRRDLDDFLETCVIEPAQRRA